MAQHVRMNWDGQLGEFPSPVALKKGFRNDAVLVIE